MRATRWKIREQRSRLHSVCTICGIEFGRFCGGSHESVDAGCSGRGSHAGIGGRRLLDREARRPGRHTTQNRRRNTADTGSPRARRSGHARAAPTTPVAAPTARRHRRPDLDGAGSAAAARRRAGRALRLSPLRPRQQPRRRRGLPCLQQAAGDQQRQLCRLRDDHARGEVGAARGRRPAVHRRPGLRRELQGAAALGLPGPRRRQARRGQGRRGGAGRPARRRHPARQGLHPAARQRRRPADHHHQRRQGRHRGLSRQRARHHGLRPRPLRRHLPWQPADHRAVGPLQLAERHQRRPAMARHHGGAQRRQPAGDHRLPDPRDRAGLEARHLLHRRLERRPAAGAQLRGGRRAERQRPGDRHVGDGHRHRAHHLHRRRRAERLRPLAADGQAARQPRSHPAVARQRADGQGDDRRGRPRPVRRRPAQGPRCGPRRRRHGVRCDQQGFHAARARQDAVRLLRPRRDRAATSPARSMPSSTPSAASTAPARPCSSWPCCATPRRWRWPTCR